MAKFDMAQLEEATSIPAGSLHLVEMGDGSGTKTVTQEVLEEKIGEALKVGDLAQLQTEDKTNLVAAINEAAQSGGGGAAVDILDSKEEIEANTETGKAAGAAAVKAMFGELNDNLNGNILTYNESEDAYYIQHGADAVPKKLQGNSGEPELLISNEAYKSNVVTYENSTSADMYCIFSLSNFKASTSGDKITLSGCEILKKYYLQTGSLVLGCWYVKIPAGASFKAQCAAIPDTGYASNALIKIR